MLANRIRNRQDSTRYVDDFELTVMFLLNDDGFVDTVPSLNTFLVLCTRARSIYHRHICLDIIKDRVTSVMRDMFVEAGGLRTFVKWMKDALQLDRHGAIAGIHIFSKMCSVLISNFSNLAHISSAKQHGVLKLLKNAKKMKCDGDELGPLLEAISELEQSWGKIWAAKISPRAGSALQESDRLNMHESSNLKSPHIVVVQKSTRDETENIDQLQSVHTTSGGTTTCDIISPSIDVDSPSSPLVSRNMAMKTTSSASLIPTITLTVQVAASPQTDFNTETVPNVDALDVGGSVYNDDAADGPVEANDESSVSPDFDNREEDTNPGNQSMGSEKESEEIGDKIDELSETKVTESDSVDKASTCTIDENASESTTSSTTSTVSTTIKDPDSKAAIISGDNSDAYLHLRVSASGSSSSSALPALTSFLGGIESLSDVLSSSSSRVSTISSTGISPQNSTPAPSQVEPIVPPKSSPRLRSLREFSIPSPLLNRISSVESQCSNEGFGVDQATGKPLVTLPPPNMKPVKSILIVEDKPSHKRLSWIDVKVGCPIRSVQEYFVEEGNSVRMKTRDYRDKVLEKRLRVEGSEVQSVDNPESLDSAASSEPLFIFPPQPAATITPAARPTLYERRNHLQKQQQAQQPHQSGSRKRSIEEISIDSDRFLTSVLAIEQPSMQVLSPSGSGDTSSSSSSSSSSSRIGPSGGGRLVSELRLSELDTSRSSMHKEAYLNEPAYSPTEYVFDETSDDVVAERIVAMLAVKGPILSSQIPHTYQSMFGEKMDITDSTGKKVKLGAFMNQIDRVENLADSQEHPLYALKEIEPEPDPEPESIYPKKKRSKLSSKVCKYFATLKGCARGDQCKYRHDSSETSAM